MKCIKYIKRINISICLFRRVVQNSAPGCVSGKNGRVRTLQTVVNGTTVRDNRGNFGENSGKIHGTVGEMLGFPKEPPGGLTAGGRKKYKTSKGDLGKFSEN